LVRASSPAFASSRARLPSAMNSAPKKVHIRSQGDSSVPGETGSSSSTPATARSTNPPAITNTSISTCFLRMKV
jgi:hypothetical protein